MKTALFLVAMCSVASADSKAWSTGKSVINADASVVGGISAGAVRNSDLYKQWIPVLMAQAGDAKKAFDQIQSTCNIDVLGSIDSVAFGVDDKKAGTIVVAFRGTDHKAIDACFKKLGDADKKPVTIKTEGKLSRYEGMADQPIFMQWLASDVVAISTETNDKDKTQKLLAGGITGVAKLKSPIANVNKGSSLWFVVDKAAMDGDTGDIQQIYGNADVANKKITITSHITTTNADAATQLAAKGTKKLADAQGSATKAVQTAIGAISIKTAGADVVATASLKEEDVVPLVTSLMMR
ncbi:MAG: hypothetical protein QM831_08195 [Kofleriaceae bacterium]